jgi:uncharacterized repeat protein (TIGR01451 family)
MRKVLYKSALTAALATCLSLTLWSQGKVNVVLTANKIVVVNGSEKKEPGDKAKPGDVIEYVADYTNTDKQSVNQVQANLPVPSGMEYLPGTAVPANVTATTDGTHFAPVPLKRSVKGADGKMKEELVPTSEYKSLRWDLGEIGAGATKSVKTRMKVKTQK